MEGDGVDGQHRDRLRVPGHLHRRMVEIARTFRREPTRSERLLWQALRGGRIDGCRFRRQQPIGPLVVDFFCPRHRLIVEVDGPIHDHQQDRDRERQLLLEECGYRVLTVSSQSVETNLPTVIAKIRSTLVASPDEDARRVLSPLPREGEGPGVRAAPNL